MILRLIFIAIAGFITYQIWRQPGVRKLEWFFAGILFFPQTIILVESPYLPFQRYMSLVLFGVTILQGKFAWREFKKFPLKWAIVVLIIALFLIGMADGKNGIPVRLFRFGFTFIENFAVVFCSYYFVRSISGAFQLFRSLFRFFIVFGVYGLINFAFSRNFYGAFLASVYEIRDLSNKYNVVGSDRFRISSFAWHPIFYGLLLALMIVLTIFLLSSNVKHFTRQRNRNWLYAGLGLLSVNLLLTNSRTPLLAALAGVFVFIFFAFNLQRKFNIAVYGLIAASIFVIASPKALGILEETVNTFTNQGSKLEGSSIAMRNIQLKASVALFYEKPLFGHGFSYIVEGLGFGARGKKKTSDEAFAGFESYAYKLLIEQGLAGIISNTFLFLSIYIYCIKRIFKSTTIGRKAIYMVMGSTLTFVMFILGTGDMGGFLFYMSLLGVTLKLIQFASIRAQMRTYRAINQVPVESK